MKKCIIDTVQAYYKPPTKFSRKDAVSVESETAPGPIRNIVNTSGPLKEMGKSRGSIATNKSADKKREKEGSKA